MKRYSWISATTLMFIALCSISLHVQAGGGPACGDAMLDAGEQCDDGNVVEGDGCTRLCEIEAGFQCTPTYIPLSGSNAIGDGGFEEGDNNSFWQDTSTVQPPNICNLIDCPNGAGSRFGAHWLQVGGSEGDIFKISQDFEIPTGANFLRFDVRALSCAQPGSPDDVSVILNGVPVWTGSPSNELCLEANGNYQSVTINLSQIPDGNFEGPSNIMVFMEPVVGETIVAFDNFEIDRQIAPSVPSVCTLNGNVQVFDQFEGIGAPLQPPDYFQQALGKEPLPWGTTDDGLCGFGAVPPGNFTGGSGEAACIDSTVLGGPGFPLVESYVCLAPIDLSGLLDLQLSFLLNYQPGPISSFDFFGLWVGTEPFLGPLDLGINTAQFFTNEPVGVPEVGPGELIDVDLSQFSNVSEVYICLGYGNEDGGYAQVDNLLLISNNCIDDFEEDKLMDCEDNCVLQANPSQTDSDNDGLGNACDADIARNVVTRSDGSGNGNDCIVNFVDFTTFAQAMFSSPVDENWNPDADFNNDFAINFLDLSVFANSFLQAPGPSAVSTACNVGGGTL